MGLLADVSTVGQIKQPALTIQQPEHMYVVRYCSIWCCFAASRKMFAAIKACDFNYLQNS